MPRLARPTLRGRAPGLQSARRYRSSQIAHLQNKSESGRAQLRSLFKLSSPEQSQQAPSQVPCVNSATKLHQLPISTWSETDLPLVFGLLMDADLSAWSARSVWSSGGRGGFYWRLIRLCVRRVSVGRGFGRIGIDRNGDFKLFAKR